MKKRWKDIRNAFVMFCVMVAMLSTATYAWFTLTDSPTVNGLKLTAATTGGLQICETENGTYSNLLELNETTAHKLTPVTPTGAATFAKPVYTGNAVNSTEGLTLDYSTDNNYVVKYTYYLKSTGGDTVKVGLMGGKDDGSANPAGSFVVRTTQNQATMQAASAIRVGFHVGNVWKIYEPNADVTGTGTMATNGVTALVSDLQQTEAGSFTKGGSGTTSEMMFEVDGTPKMVEMYVWLEGTDDQCADEIQTDELKAQIQFTVVN